jgi:ribosomal protein S18 acetylase RimI-like enzyme
MEPTTFILKTSKEITIRLADIEDASKLLSMKLDYLKDSKTIPLFPNEYHDDIKIETQLIKRLLEEKNSALFVAESEGKLIGNIDFNGNQRLKLFHTGVVGMGIKETWRGKGLGSALMEALIKWSKNNPFITLLWLEVYDSNEGGKALYRKMRFKECGRMENFFHQDNKNIDKITMVRHL